MAAFLGRRGRPRGASRARCRTRRGGSGPDRSRRRLGPPRCRGRRRAGAFTRRRPARSSHVPRGSRWRACARCNQGCFPPIPPSHGGPTPQRCRGSRRRRWRRAFQHAPGNELAGIEGRAALLRRLGEVCAANPAFFGTAARPGNLYDYWAARREELTRPRNPAHFAAVVRADLAGAHQSRRRAAR